MLIQADARHIPLADGSVQCCVTSPPYWGLRDYQVPGQLGLERTPEEYLANMVSVFREVKRVLRKDGTCWVNMGDGYVANASNQVPQTKRHIGSGFSGPNRNGMTGLKPKDLIGMPWRLAFALQAEGWWLRSDIVWAKPNPMPESCTDRPTKAHEYIFLLTKSARYYWDAEAIREPAKHAGEIRKLGEKSLSKGQARGAGIKASGNGNADSIVVAEGRNIRTVWSIATAPYPEAHFATFPPEIPKRCILAGTSARGCCAECVSPWERVVDSTSRGSRYSTPKDNGSAMRNDSEKWAGRIGEKSTITTGWRPTCQCGASVVPCTVLDPFLGSGTTVMVAESLGRRGIGMELKPEYLALAKKRCQVTRGLPL
jgi:DNA modification methylase